MGIKMSQSEIREDLELEPALLSDSDINIIYAPNPDSNSSHFQILKLYASLFAPKIC